MKDKIIIEVARRMCEARNINPDGFVGVGEVQRLPYNYYVAPTKDIRAWNIFVCDAEIAIKAVYETVLRMKDSD